MSKQSLITQKELGIAYPGYISFIHFIYISVAMLQMYMGKCSWGNNHNMYCIIMLCIV